MATLNQSDIEQIKSKLDKISTSVDRLERTLIGDEKFGVVGLIARIEEIEDYVEKGKANKNKLVGGFVVLTILEGILLKFWDKLF